MLPSACRRSFTIVYPLHFSPCLFHSYSTKADKKKEGDRRASIMTDILYDPARINALRKQLSQERELEKQQLKQQEFNALDQRTLATLSKFESNELTPAEQHGLIERMWALEKMKEAEAISMNLNKKFIKMRQAMLELEKTDKRLFAGAVAPEDPDAITTFPKKFRIPTETMPTRGWVYKPLED